MIFVWSRAKLGDDYAYEIDRGFELDDEAYDERLSRFRIWKDCGDGVGTKYGDEGSDRLANWFAWRLHSLVS